MSSLMVRMQLMALPRTAALVISTLMVLAAGAAIVARPTLVSVDDAPDLESTVPQSFGDWKLLPNPRMQVSTTTADGPDQDQPYDQTVMRSYVNSKGEVVMLALAWGRRQQQEVKVHRPDLCYVAQGYQVKSLAPAHFAVSDPAIRPVGKHMVALSGRGGEAVSYWIRIGTLYSEDAWETRLQILKDGFKGHIPDGILVRASVPLADPSQAAAAWPVLDRFLFDLTAAVPLSARALLLR